MIKKIHQLYSGRMSRKPFCFAALSIMLLGFPISITIEILADEEEFIPFFSIVNGLSFILMFGIAYWISIIIRRLHDLNYTGWWVIGVLLTGPIYVIAMFFIKGTPGSNRYGELPKES